MLVLTVQQGDSIWIADNIRVCVTELLTWRNGCREVRLGISAPRDVAVHRLEVQQRIEAERDSA